jgi:hypothetical protein
MNKIPIGDTIVFAYSFVFVHIGTIVGIAGIPAVLSAAIDYGVRNLAAAQRAALDAGDAGAVGLNLAVWLGGLIATIFLSSIATVGITRAALGQRLERAVYLTVGRTELRMFAAKLRFWLGVLALAALVGLIAVLAFSLAGIPFDAAAPNGPPDPAVFLASLIVWVVIGYALATALRMGFLLPATVVVEDKGGLRRSYDLTRGNAWRLVAIAFGLGAPIFVLVSVAAFAVLGSMLGGDSVQVLEQATMTDFVRRGELAVQQNLLAWEIFNAVIFILASGLIYSGSAYAYRALTPGRGKNL